MHEARTIWVGTSDTKLGVYSRAPVVFAIVPVCPRGQGWAIGSVGISLHSLPLLYLGSGLVGGFGMALGYLAPVATLVRWFPDKVRFKASW